MSTRRLVAAGALSGAVAAAVVTALAAAAPLIDVSLEVDGQAIPLGAFVWWVLVGAVVGTVLARFLRPRLFVQVALGTTALSLVPALAIPDDLESRLVLAALHVVAAAIIVPALTRVERDADTLPER